MKLTPVESSHVAGIGYLEAERVLLVRYKDGALYAQPQVDAGEYVAMLAAPSKGKWLYCRDRKGVNPIPISKGGTAEDIQSRAERAVPPPAAVDQSGPLNDQRAHMQDAERVPAAPLNVLDEDADRCCRKSLTKSLDQFPLAQIMACGECGQEFVPEMVGPNRYWRVKPFVAIVRRGR